MKVTTKRSQAKAYKKPKRDHHPNRCAERTLQNQCVITSPSRAKDQPRKLNQKLTSESLQKNNAVSPSRSDLVRKQVDNHR
jgi:hypothetical protein